MYNNKTFLAIIPARGGSKRLPKKNILDLNGKPLIAWSIEAGLKSKYIDKVLVTSDNDEVLNISDSFGAITLKRPSKLATDTSTTYGAIEHAIENHQGYDYIVILQPTSPLRTSYHIDEAIKKLEDKNSDALIGVCETEHSPLWCNTLDENNCMENFLSDTITKTRSQDLPKYYRINGAMYICDTKQFLREKNLYLKKNIHAYIMNREDSIDIDTKLDFLIAQTIIENK
jgi:CMP-N,N'-diacetyllegionaminic acid synthase